MKRTASALLSSSIIAAATALMLTGCASDGADTAPAKTSQPSATSDVKIKKLVGGGSPDDVSILCVKDSAFLYVYTHGFKEGGPSLARFPEQDDICTAGKTTSPQPSDDTTH